MTVPWHLQPMVALDLETTGPNPDTARIVTATIIEVSTSGVGQVYEWLVNPGIPIPAGATAVHGVTTEKAWQEGRPAAEAVGQITDKLARHLSRGTPVVAFNAAYDFTVIDREGMRNGLGSLLAAPIIDPHVIDKQLIWRKGKRTLTAVCEYHGITLTDAHTSHGDALAAARLAYVLAARHPVIGETPLTALHDRQARWRREQAASLQDYFRSPKGGKPDAVVNGDWPIQQLPAGWTPADVDREDVPA